LKEAGKEIYKSRQHQEEGRVNHNRNRSMFLATL